MAQKPTAKHTLVSDPQLAQLLKDYEAGLRAMQEHKYDKAKTLLQKVVSGTNRELADRAKQRFPIGSPGWVRADDIVAFNKNHKQNPLRIGQ